MDNSPMVIGHRGWPARFPDNTLAGALSASSVADGIEIDVRRSSDGKLVLAHDADLGGLPVAATPWAILAEVDLGGGHHPALLDELVATVPDLSIDFEIKNSLFEPGFEPDHRLGLEAAERARPGDLLTSFNWMTLSVVRRAFPDVATGLLLDAGGDVRDAVNFCHEGGHGAVLPSVAFPADALHPVLESGLRLIPWVVNDQVLAGELADLGVAGMITDDPALIRAVIGRNP